MLLALPAKRKHATAVFTIPAVVFVNHPGHLGGVHGKKDLRWFGLWDTILRPDKVTRAKTFRCLRVLGLLETQLWLHNDHFLLVNCMNRVGWLVFASVHERCIEQ